LAGHGETEDRHREDKADPKPPRYVSELGIARLGGLRMQRLERHAADRAGARFVAADLGMHRAGPDRAGDFGLRGCGRFFYFAGRRSPGLEILQGIGEEFLAALAAAEEIVLALLARA